MKTKELLSCPFCGSPPVRACYPKDDHVHYAKGIECLNKKCNARSGLFSHYSEAEKAWNNRVNNNAKK